MSGRFDPADRHNDAIVEAIHAAARHITATLKEGFQLMADAQAQALADLSAAVSDMATAVTVAINEIQSLVGQIANVQPNDSAAIEAQVNAIKNATAALAAANNAPPVANAAKPDPTPAPPANPAP